MELIEGHLVLFLFVKQHQRREVLVEKAHRCLWVKRFYYVGTCADESALEHKLLKSVALRLAVVIFVIPDVVATVDSHAESKLLVKI